MGLGKLVRYAWYRVMRAAPTNGSRMFALNQMGIADVGDDCYVGPNLTITPFGRDDVEGTLIELGDRATISPDVKFLCSMHPEESTLSEIYGDLEAIEVGHDAWIGAGASILGGVSIGSESVVGAGAVVTEDVPSRTVVGGVPAEKIREIEGLET